MPWNVKSDKKGDACDGDWDNDSIPNASDANPGRPVLDITYDDNADGTWKGTGDTGTSWDSDSNAKLDGVQTLCPVAGPGGTSDADGDGLLNSWEVPGKWVSSPFKVDSDGDTKGDCVEAADVDGNGVVKASPATSSTTPRPSSSHPPLSARTAISTSTVTTL